MRDIWLSAFGYTVTCRVSELSLKLNVSRDLIKEMALDALGQISNDVNLRFEDICISRNRFKAQFVPDSLAKDMSILQMRSNPRSSPDKVDGVRSWGGMFKKVQNYLGLFYLYITENPEMEMSVPALEPARDATKNICPETAPRPLELSPVRDRKRELYKTLFDEGMDDSDRSESTEKPMKKLSKSASKRVPSKKSNESKSSSEEKDKKPKGEIPVKYRRSLIGMARGDEAYVPFGENEGVLTYNPSKIGQRVEAGKHIPKYVPTVKEKKNMNGNDGSKYVPSKISTTLTTKATYIPTEVTSTSQSQSSKPTKSVTHKTSPKRTLEVHEYVPAIRTSQVSTGVCYKPTAKNSIRSCRLDKPSHNAEEVYEPPGVSDSKLQYRNTARLGKFIQSIAVHFQSITGCDTFEPNVASSTSPLQLRTVRRKRVENTPEKPDAQKRFRQSKAPAPEKCLMPDWMFDRMEENQDYIDDLTYSEKEIVQLDAEISRIESVKNLTESHIRYLFYKLETEIISVAVGKPPRHRHDLFMKEQNAVLNNAIPIKAVSSNQLDLIKKLCLDHFNRKYGFQIFYVIQVLLPEVIIRFHMLINGTTYEESDRQTDMGIVNTGQWQTDLERLRPDFSQRTSAKLIGKPAERASLFPPKQSK